MSKTIVKSGEIIPQKIPQDIEAEKSLLCNFFQKNALIDSYRGKIEPRHFYREAHRVLYKAMLNLRARGQNVDLVTVKNELEKMNMLERVGGIPFLTEINNISFTTANAEQYKQIILDKWAAHAVIEQCDKIKQQAEAGNFNASDVLAKGANDLLSESFKLQNRASYMPESAANIASLFIPEVISKRTPDAYPTGFKELDAILDGGLFPGLYVVGAISSLGKTTFSLQIADNIAERGKHVLFFSLEMSKREIIAKSLSRRMMQAAMKKYKNTKHAKTTRDIMKGAAGWSAQAQELFLDADAWYHTIQDPLYVGTKPEHHPGDFLAISEGSGNIGYKEIRAAVQAYKVETGVYPVVVIDYLQIMAPADPRATDKQNTDKTVLELKRMSRDFNVPVLAISSFNRENYNTAVNMAAFKESGAVEYSADVLIGLQYGYMMRNKEDKTEKARAERIAKERDQVQEKAAQGLPILVDAVILKNRNGARGHAPLNFMPKFNCYKDAPAPWDAGTPSTTGTSGAGTLNNPL